MMVAIYIVMLDNGEKKVIQNLNAKDEKELKTPKLSYTLYINK